MKIQSTKDIHASAGLKMLVYSASGVGKTSLAKTLPGRTLVISAEKGLLSIAGCENIDFIDMSTDDDGNTVPQILRGNRLREAYALLNSAEYKKKYKCVMLDSVTEIAENVLAAHKAAPGAKKNGWEIYGGYAEEAINIIKAFRDLEHYHVVFTALEDEQKDENARRFFGPQMPGKAATEFIQPAFDELFRLTIVDVDGKPQRQIVTCATSVSRGKDRSGKLDPTEPADLGAIINKISKLKEEK